MTATKNREDLPIAYHEASHAVAMYVLRREAFEQDQDFHLTIVPHGDVAGCQSSEYPLYDGCSTEYVEAAVIEHYAGAAGQLRAFPQDPETVKGGAEDDDEKAEHFLGLIGGRNDETRARLRQRAAQVVEEAWPLIERVAADLGEHKKLDKFEFEYLVEGDLEELADYRRRRPEGVG